MWICKHCGWERKDEPKETWQTCPSCDNFNWMKEGERNDIQWTTAPPTIEGFYWAIAEYYFTADTKEPTTVKVRKVGTTGLLGVLIVGIEGVSSLSEFTHWLGPLPVPGLPKGE